VQLTVPGGGALVVRQGQATPGASSHAVMVRVADVDAHHARALAAGAAVGGTPTTYPFGERQYGARDLAGHAWVFTQSVADVHPADWGGDWVAAPGPQSPPMLPRSEDS
jgi:predicted enzyme related to lactoylglutathione lyase